MTKQEAAIVAAYTGFMIGSFADMHEYIEKVLGREVYTHEMANPQFMERLREAAKADFCAMEVK